MTRHADMITLIADLFMDAYMAGQQTELSSYNRARADRDRLFDVVRDLYAELEHESYQREQFEVELMKANNELANLRDQVRSQQETIRKLTEDDEEVPDHHDAFDAMFPGCTPDDLPFPDVDDLAPASELLGGDE